MASIEKRKESYRITVSCGMDGAGKQIKKSMTWKPSPGMTQKQIEKEVQRQAVLFEERCKSGRVLAGNIRFSDFVEVWRSNYAETHLKPTTYARYNSLLERILPALGNIRLNRLQPHHITAFESNLAEAGIKKSDHWEPKIDFVQILQNQGLNNTTAGKLSGTSATTIRKLKTGGTVSFDSAQKIAQSLGYNASELFRAVECDAKLAPKTLLQYHRLLSAILQIAVEWQVIPSNPCSHVRAPRVNRREAEYFEDAEALYILRKLQDEDAAHRAMIYILLYTGMRRGEMLGLSWNNIDFEKHTISIQKNSVYISGKGIITDTPKTEGSVRTYNVSKSVINALTEHKHAQNIQRLAVGADWVDSDRIFTQWNGKPMFPNSISSWFKAFLQRINIPGNRSLKSLRHTNASLLIASGIDIRTVAGRLGHTQTSTTSNIYAHMLKTSDELAADALENRLSGQPGEEKSGG